MRKMPFGKTFALLLVIALLVAFASVGFAYEVQLAGIRLGDSATRLLAVYGTPDGVIVGSGGGTAAAQTPGGSRMPGMPGGMMPGMPGGMMPSMPTGPGAMMPGVGAGPGMPPMMMGGPGMMGPGAGVRPQGPPIAPGMNGGGAGHVMQPGMGAMPPMPPMATGGGARPAGAPGPMMSMPSGPGAGPGMPGMPGAAGMPGMMGARGGAMGGGAAGSSGSVMNALKGFKLKLRGVETVSVPLQSGEVEWIYSKEAGVNLGFVLNQEGLVTAIVVAGPSCPYARTALGAANKTITLGDGFKKVIYRYGVPDAFEPVSAGGATSDLVLRYTNKSNIAFTLMGMTVSRIHIWQPE